METGRRRKMALLLAGAILVPFLAPAQEPADGDTATPQIHISERGIQVVRSASGVFLYTYPETLEALDPLADYTTQLRVTDADHIRELESLITETLQYTHDYRKRCYPVWQYGLEFRKSPTERRTFLFSFPCGTIKLLEEGIYRDFDDRKSQFQKIFKEIQNSP